MGILRQWPSPKVELPKAPVGAPRAAGAWPAPVVPGQTATAAQYNAVVSSLADWGGDVAANEHSLTNVLAVVGDAITKLLRLTGIVRAERFSDAQNYVEVNCESLPAKLSHSLGQLEIDCQILKVSGAVILPIRTVSANTTLTSNDYTVICNPGITTVTLPANPPAGMLLNIRNSTGGLLTLNGNGQVVAGAVATLLNANAMMQYDAASGVWIAL